MDSSDDRIGLVVRALGVTIDTPEGRLAAVDDCDLTLGRGRSIGLVGESGSGKSLLCRSIMGLTRSTMRVTGSIRVDGTEVNGLAAGERRRLWGSTMAMVFQDPMTALSPVTTIGTQLGRPIRYHSGVGRKAAAARSLELLEQVGIPDALRRLRQYPHELSGGMRQRVVVALAICNTPSYLFADEPTTALDVTVQAQVLDLLDSLRDGSGIGMVLCSHDLHVIRGRTDEVHVMYAGQIVESGPTEGVFRTPHMPYTEALLRSVPDFAQPPHSRLAAIPGRPPQLDRRPHGCRFAPRCEFASSQCQSAPPLVETTDGRRFRCWHPRNQPVILDPPVSSSSSNRHVAGFEVDR